MPGSGVQLFRTAPGTNTLVPLIKRFCASPEGLVTSLEDSMLPVLKQIVGGQEDIEVSPFGTLVRRVLASSGETAELLATRSQYLAAIGQAAAFLDSDSHLKGSLRFLGIREAIAETLSDFHGYRIPLDALLQNEQLPCALKNKLADLEILDRHSKRLLFRMGKTLSSEQIEESLGAFIDPEMRLPRILVVSGARVPPNKVAWIRWLEEQGCEVILAMPYHISGAELFGEANFAQDELGGTALKIGAPNRLVANLFGEGNSTDVPIPATVAVAANATSECEWAVRSVAENKAGDCAIYVRDIDGYAPLLAAASQSLGVRLCIQRRVNLLENSFAQLTLACLEALSQGDVRMLLPLLHRSYLRVERSVRLQVEAIIQSSRKVPDNQWQILEELSSELPADGQWLRKLVTYRREIFREVSSLVAWAQRLRDLVDILPWQEAMGVVTGYDNERDERAFHVMQTSLATEAQLENAGESSYSFKQFVNKCGVVWQDADVSIPSGEGVPVVSSAWAIPPVKKLIVMGMLEGVFPRRRREDPILSDFERAQISNNIPDCRRLPTSLDSAANDRDEFYALCCFPTESISFSYPLVGEDRDNIPTFYLERVRDAHGHVQELDLTKNGFEAPVPTPECVCNVPLAATDAEDQLLLAQARSIRVSPQELRDASICPFQFQMRHRLRLQRGPTSTAWFRLRTLPETGRLMTAADEAEAHEQLSNCLQFQLDSLVPELKDWELRLLRGGGERLISEWIRREFASRSLWPRVPGSYGGRALGETGLRELMPGELQLAIRVAGITHMNEHSKVLHLYDNRAPQGADLDEHDRLYYGIFLLASHEPGMESVLEVDGMDGGRSLLLFDREPLPKLHSQTASNLKVLDLTGDASSPKEAKRKFYTDLKSNLGKAAAVVHKGVIRAVPGDHCEWCEYGELCRASKFFGEGAFIRRDADE